MIVFGAQSAIKTLDTFFKYPLNHFRLSFIEPVAIAFIKLALFDHEVDCLLGKGLGIQNHFTEVGYPTRYFQVSVVFLKGFIVALFMILNSMGYGNQSWFAKALSGRRYINIAWKAI